MKNLMLSFAIFFLMGSFASAQNITGTWKRTSIILAKNDGSKSDMFQSQLKSMPCAATITYTYAPGGQVTIDAGDCTNMKKMLEAMNGKTTWRQRGNKITINSGDEKFPIQIYNVSFEGSTMIWLFNYTDNPKTPNPTQAKSMTIVYKR
ncbi:hypothetical protein [Dyadobacter diqingensis]|uniref:hypothetical protein n=1 Tax=Dyadobacter diqingensis TaxID=2938121 RepID=UPI0020C4047E|nr:hypothetical protein [Dyadobacter diqingensis]